MKNNLERFKLFHKNVMINQQSIITPYDIHDTMIHVFPTPDSPNKTAFTDFAFASSILNYY